MAGRDPKTGRFVAGNPGGPGRPRGEKEYLLAMQDAASVSDWQRATAKMLKRAIAGDVSAYKAIAPYLVGLPVQKLQLSNPDAALLAELLALFEQQGLSAGEVFAAMMAEFAQGQQVVTDDE